MSTTAGGHLDKRTVKKEGWFQKDPNQPIPDYRANCADGYLGPRHEVHHVLPQTSIEESVSTSGKDVQYVTDVQYITPWNINGPDNLLGLPHYHAYDLYYQGRARLAAQVDSENVRSLVSWFNKFSTSSRKSWLQEVFNVSPEGYPVHNPVNWGHTKYNEKVMKDIERQVWNQLNDKKKKHELDAKSVKAQLDALASKHKGKLKQRGADACQSEWDKRVDPKNNDWHKPFTMTNVANPIFG